MKLFGKAKKAPPPKETLTKLRETQEMLEKRENHLQKKIDREVAEAKKFMAVKNKRAAMMCLKRKKTYEKQMETISGARMSIDTQIMAIEGASVGLETMQALKLGADTLKGIHGAMDVNRVDETMADVQEQLELANEINDAIGQNIGLDVDEDELEAELEELEQQRIGDQLLEIKSPMSQPLPSASRLPNPQLDDDDAELRALEESMAM